MKKTKEPAYPEKGLAGAFVCGKIEV